MPPTLTATSSPRTRFAPSSPPSATSLFTEIFPGRTDVPKTLIFAKDDTHADDIVRICREVFGKGNDFCQKITYRTGFVRIVEKKQQADGTEVEQITWKRASSLSPEEILSAFRNSYFPRIAVTVDMIATGTDIKPLEIVFFMRSVASKNFFEQMKGRGVRVVSDTEMEQVNPGIKRKTRYVIVDAVGVCERVQTESRPLEKKPTVSFEKLLDAAALGTTEVAAIESLAGRLIRLERRFDAEVEAEVVQTAKGQTLSQIAKGLLDAVDPDKVEEASRLLAGEDSGGTPLPLSAPVNYFDPEAPIAFLSGDLPHWRQEGTTYFVTFRLADSLPQEKLQRWRAERDQWMQMHPEPHDEAARREYYELFPQRLQQWLDAGSGSCVLAIPEVKKLVEESLRHFDGERYRLHEFVVAPNHVHVLVSPSGEHTLSEILHSWKSFTAHKILKVAEWQSRPGSESPEQHYTRRSGKRNPSTTSSAARPAWGSSAHTSVTTVASAEWPKWQRRPAAVLPRTHTQTAAGRRCHIGQSGPRAAGHESRSPQPAQENPKGRRPDH